MLRFPYALFMVTLTACGSSHPPGDVDSGLRIDAGDSRDAGDHRDGGSDAATRLDAGSALDGGPDAGPDVDGGTPGAVCTNEAPCTGGTVCAGESCDETWRCVETTVACTDDEAPYCGCDGVTFFDSSTCPTRPFLHRGECSTVSCDARRVTCDSLPPVCRAGLVPSIAGGCWGRCVPIDACECAGADECPMPKVYTCHNSAGRCGPYL